jgi:zinc protease
LLFSGFSLPTLKLLAALAASSLLIAPGLADAQSRSAAPDNRQAESRSTAARAQAAGNVLGDPDKAAPDPSVKQGVLPNGLRYAVVSSKTPAKAISFRLYVNVGSYDETDQERGVAHFIEHMAFNGTKHIPEGRVDTMFGVKGVAFGRDQNAETGYFGTTYMLDVPQVDGDKLDLAFAWMRDIADGENLEQAAIDRERGVILAEDDRSKGPERDWGERLQKFLSPELRTSTRDPIGTREVLNHANAALLRGFYEKWYRPDNAILVVVGDVPTEELEKRIGETFSSWTGKGAAPVRVARSTPNLSRSFDVLASTETALPTSVSLCYVRKHDQDIPDSQARTKLRLERRLWRDVINERLRAMAASEDPPFARAEVSFRESEHEALYACLDVLPLKDDWRRGFDAGMGEVKRALAHGVTASEAGRALEGVRAEYRAAADSSGTLSDAARAARILDAQIRGDTIATMRERFRLLDRVALNVTEKTVADAFKRDWSGAGPFLIVTTPQEIKAADAKTAFRQAMAKPAPGAPVAAAAAQWAYGDFGPQGKVAERKEVATPGFTRITFENGVVLNFKRLTASQDKVKVRVRFGSGRREIATEDYYAAQMGAALFSEGGLGKHDPETIRRLFNDHGWGANLAILDDAFVLSGDTNPTDVGVEMQILAAFLTDPGFRRSADAKLPTAMELMLRQSRTSPEFAVSQALNRTVAPDGIYVVPPRERLLAIDTKAFERIFKPALTTSPLEVTVVGDVSEDRVVDAVSRTLGALPARHAQDRTRKDTWFLRFPQQTPPVIRTTYESATDKAIVSLVWPLYVAEPKRRREEYALNLLSNALDDAIRHKVREQMGKSYAPSVGMSSPDAADQGQIAAYIETTAADADAVAQAARETAAEVAAHGITQEAFDAARKPVLDNGATRLDDIDWWAGGLDGSAGNYEILREFVDWEADMSSVTLSDVNRYAKVWLAQNPIVVVATPVAPTTTAAAVAPTAPAKKAKS